MDNLVWYLRGYWILEIHGAEPDRVLNRLTKERIPFWSLKHLDLLTVEICVFQCDMSRIQEIAANLSCEVSKITKTGFIRSIQGLFRPVLVSGVFAMLLVLFAIPNFLLFFHVRGNNTVSASEILRHLEGLGVGFGTIGSQVDPQWIKDHMLNSLRQLQWITVTQNGCLAQVVVRERPETPNVIDRRGFANVIATQSGMITDQSILAGQALKKPGDIVLKGEMLVSGVVDLERVYAMEYAQAEIYAKTWRKTEIVTPSKVLKKTGWKDTRHCIWLEIGKERIKIFGNSGIYTNACDKMISRKTLSLPGGYQLPVALMIETVMSLETEQSRLDKSYAADLLTKCAVDAAMSDMQAGEILRNEWSMTEEWGVYRLDSVLECHEMIAKTVEAKWNEEDFTDD